MNGRKFWALRGISDDELEASLSGLLATGARVEARIVAHLAEVEARRLHLLAGYSSLYDYCRTRLGLSDYEAFIRIAAARIARRYPVVFEMLERRQLHLTAICEVRAFLTAENHQDLFEAVSGKTKLQIREFLAQRFPHADVPTSLKKLPAFEPLSPGRYRLQLTLSAEQKEKLELARDLLSHANSSGDLAVVVERALDELISRLEKRRFGRAQPRPAHAEPSLAANRGAPATTEWNASKAGADEQREARETKPTGALRDVLGALAASRVLASEQNDDGTRAASGAHASERDDRGALATSKRSANEQTEGAGEMCGWQGPKAAPGESDETRRARRRKHIANQTRRELLARDGVGCAFVGRDGQRCEARAFLQFHHRRAWARGGSDTADNLELLCRSHNSLLAERDFGRSRIDAAIAARNVEEPE